MERVMSLAGRARYRVRQMLGQLDLRSDADTDQALRALLTRPQWRLVARLSGGDRRHLLRVHRELIRQGHTDQDLLLAALLHDVGKADDRGRVTLFHRMLKVLLHRFAPRRLEALAQPGDGWIRRGMRLAIHHPSLGAEFARRAGANERTCWLIQRHDDGTIQGDAALDALQAIDARG